MNKHILSCHIYSLKREQEKDLFIYLLQQRNTQFLSVDFLLFTRSVVDIQCRKSCCLIEVFLSLGGVSLIHPLILAMIWKMQNHFLAFHQYQ